MPKADLKPDFGFQLMFYTKFYGNNVLEKFNKLKFIARYFFAGVFYHDKKLKSFPRCYK